MLMQVQFSKVDPFLRCLSCAGFAHACAAAGPLQLGSIGAAEPAHLCLLVDVDSFHGVLHQVEVRHVISARDGSAAGAIEVAEALEGVRGDVQLLCLPPAQRLDQLRQHSTYLA